MSEEDGRYQHENAEQMDAFEYYYSLGQERTLQEVADEFGKSLRTIYAWSSAFNWQERIKQRDIEIGKRLKEKTIDTVVKEKARYRKIIQLAISKFVKDLKNGEVKAKSIKDLERLIKLDLTLMGEPAEVSEEKTDNTHTLTKEDREAVERLTDGLQGMLDDVDVEEEE